MTGVERGGEDVTRRKQMALAWRAIRVSLEATKETIQGRHSHLKPDSLAALAIETNESRSSMTFQRDVRFARSYARTPHHLVFLSATATLARDSHQNDCVMQTSQRINALSRCPINGFAILG